MSSFRNGPMCVSLDTTTTGSELSSMTSVLIARPLCRTAFPWLASAPRLSRAALPGCTLDTYLHTLIAYLPERNHPRGDLLQVGARYLIHPAAQLTGVAFQRDLPLPQDNGPVGEAQRRRHMLLDAQ